MKRGRAGEAALEEGGQEQVEKEETEEGEKKRRAQREIIKNLQLKKILKENHGCPIKQLAFNTTREANHNLLATVGDTQANIYDNENQGWHLDLMCNYVNGDKKSKKHQLLSCAWMADLDLDADGQDTDTYLAVGAADGSVLIISIANCRVLAILNGHKGAVIDLVPHPTRPGLLLSVGLDSQILLWNCVPLHLKDRVPLCRFEASAQVACFAADGQRFLSGGHAGLIKEWNIPSECFMQPPGKDEDAVRLISEHKRLQKRHRGDIDCIELLGDVFVTKDVEGKIVLWRHEDEEEVRSLRIPDCPGHTRSRFSISKDGKLLCAGNSSGCVYIFDLESGALLRQLHHSRAKAPILSCLFSHDCRHVVIAGGEPIIWRWSFVAPAAEETSQ